MKKSKEIKREEAQERQEVYNSLTTPQKISRLPIGGKSLKELHKLKHRGSAPTSSVHKPKSDKLSRKERWAKKQHQS